MNRIEQIKRLALTDCRLTSDIIAALLSQLSLDDATSVLLESLIPNHPLRVGALKRICRADAELQRSAIAALVDALETRLARATAKSRGTVASALSSIARTVCDERARLRIQQTLASSPFIPIRRRSYTMHDAAIPGSVEILQATWLEHRDTEAAWLVTKDCPVDFLRGDEASIVAALPERWMRARFVLRVSEADPGVLDAYQREDPVHAMYVYAKRKETPPDAILRSMVDASLCDPELDLLIWSLGVLGQWDALVELQGRRDDIDSARVARFARTAMVQATP